MSDLPFCRAAMVVAHPDDEVLWGGGLILDNPSWNWRIVSVCRGSAPDRAPRFFHAINKLNALGTIADLDDGPEQQPLDPDTLERTIVHQLDQLHYSTGIYS